MRYLALIVLLFGLAAICRLDAAELADTKPSRSQVANQVRESTHFQLATDKAAYEVGEPIELQIRLTNNGTTVFTVEESSEESGWLNGYLFRLHAADGKEIADPNYGYGVGSAIGGDIGVSPGESYTRTLLLNYRTNALKPGKYTIRGIHTMRSLYRGPKGLAKETDGVNIESPVITFQVNATPQAAIDDRVLRLSRQLQSILDTPLSFQGSYEFRRLASLLGFTGSDSAIAPLMKSFYPSAAKVDVMEKDAGSVFSAARSELDTVAASAAQALLYLNPEKVEAALLQALRERGPSPEPNGRMMHLLFVELRVSPHKAVPLLVPWLSDKSAGVRRQALEGIRLSASNRNSPAPDPKLLPMIIARLKDSDDRVRGKATEVVRIYAKMSDGATAAEALKALQATMKDEDEK